MEKLTSNHVNQFEEENTEKFPFSIIIRGEDEYNRIEDLFKISKPETVTGFTAFLLTELDSLLATFESDITEYSKKIN